MEQIVTPPDQHIIILLHTVDSNGNNFRLFHASDVMYNTQMTPIAS